MITLRASTLPSFKAEIAALQPQATAWVTHMLAVSVSAIETNTPVNHGHLQAWLVQTPGVQNYGARVVGSVGPTENLGIDESVAGAGHIQSFVDWYTQANGRKPGGKGGKMAWWGLTREQKDMLYRLRLGGAHGGPLPPPKYYGAIEEGKVPGTSKNVGFMRRIRSQVTAAFNSAKFDGGRASVRLG